MGCPVSKLSEIMSEREILYHLDDLRQEPELFDLLNELFGRLNKNIVNCSDFPKEVKSSIKQKDFMIELETEDKKQLSKQDLMIKARANKYRNLI